MSAALERLDRVAGVRVVDAHAHTGGCANFPIPRSDPQSMLQTMDETGVAVACIAPLLGCGPDFRAGNRLMADAVGRYPERFCGLMVVNPNYPAGLLDELRRYREVAGVRGIKLHPGFHGYPITGPAYRLVWAFAADHGLPVLVHTWGGAATSAPQMMASIAAEFPTVALLLGHSGGSWAGHLDAIEVAQRWPNVYLETCVSQSHFGAIEWMVREVGATRVVFGTDQPFIDPRPQLGRVAFAKITDEERRLILGGNAARLGLVPSAT